MARHTSTLAALLAFVFGVAATMPCQAQTWNYKSFKKSSTGAWDKNDFVPGTITVESGCNSNL